MPPVHTVGRGTEPPPAKTVGPSAQGGEGAKTARRLTAGGASAARRGVANRAGRDYRVGRPNRPPRAPEARPMRRHATLALALLAVVTTPLAPAPAAAQGLVEVKARYTKYEYKIPMRDGVRLF